MRAARPVSRSRSSVRSGKTRCYPGLRLAVLADEQRMDAKNPLVRLSAYDLPMFEKNADGHDDDHHGR